MCSSKICMGKLDGGLLGAGASLARKLPTRCWCWLVLDDDPGVAARR